MVKSMTQRERYFIKMTVVEPKQTLKYKIAVKGRNGRCQRKMTDVYREKPKNKLKSIISYSIYLEKIYPTLKYFFVEMIFLFILKSSN